MRIVLEPTLQCVRKLHFLRILVWKQVRNNHGILILIELIRKTKQWHKKFKTTYHHIKIHISLMNGGVLWISQYSPRKYSSLGFFFNKNAWLRFCNFRQYCEIFNNSCFEELLWTASSEMFSFYVSLNVFLH